jgi:hypothetical protein
LARRIAIAQNADGTEKLGNVQVKSNSDRAKDGAISTGAIIGAATGGMLGLLAILGLKTHQENSRSLWQIADSFWERR